MRIESDNTFLLFVDSVIVLIWFSVCVVLFHEYLLSSLENCEIFGVLRIQKVILFVRMFPMYLKDVDRVCGIAIDINGFFENLILKLMNFVLWFESQQERYFRDFVDKNVVGLSLKDDSTLIDPL